MKKALLTLLIVPVSFIAGWFWGHLQSTEDWSSILDFHHEIELLREYEKAFPAYAEEKKEIGIYCLTELLDEIDHRQDLIGNEENESSFTYYRIQTHTRLAKLYSDLGKEKESEFHKAKAIEASEESGKFDALFEEMNFDERLAYFDTKKQSIENQAGDDNSE